MTEVSDTVASLKGIPTKADLKFQLEQNVLVVDFTDRQNLNRHNFSLRNNTYNFSIYFYIKNNRYSAQGSNLDR